MSAVDRNRVGKMIKQRERLVVIPVGVRREHGDIKGVVHKERLVTREGAIMIGVCNNIRLSAVGSGGVHIIGKLLPGQP